MLGSATITTLTSICASSFCEKVARLADGAYHIGHDLLPGRLLDREDLVIGPVIAGPNEIVHPRVHDHEPLFFILFCVENF